jgi:hypothetical protein
MHLFIMGQCLASRLESRFEDIFPEKVMSVNQQLSETGGRE